MPWLHLLIAIVQALADGLSTETFYIFRCRYPKNSQACLLQFVRYVSCLDRKQVSV